MFGIICDRLLALNGKKNQKMLFDGFTGEGRKKYYAVYKNSGAASGDGKAEDSVGCGQI